MSGISPAQSHRGAIYALNPPYTRLDPPAGPGCDADGLLVLADPEPHSLLPMALTIRRRQPSASLLLFLTGPLELHLPTISMSRACGVRAVIRPGEEWDVVLRERITSTGPLGDLVLEWLRTHHGQLPAELPDALRALMDVEQGKPTAISARRLRARKLPTLRSWRSFGRAMRAALMIQRRPHTNLAEIALDAGYCDQPALNRAVRRCFTCAPSEMRRRIGVDWLLDRFMTTCAD